ncbi:MAG: purine-nucleoside phosphorylase [Verrucomicrobiota bacterium]|nr:purine-nucleoside phosphorylase [Verrucomicrobiota bacterium]
MSEAARDRLARWGAEIAIVLGSGLNSLVAEVEAERRVPYANFDDLPRPKVPGHTGQFILHEIGTTPVIYAQGRVHLYEGYSASDVTAGIRLLAGCGVKRVVLTNAAGIANPRFAPGEWMSIGDHLNLTGTTPLLGRPEFIDMTEVYSHAWRAAFRHRAEDLQMPLHEGIYAGLLGPQYETPAEVRMLRTLGADAIGMSTVLEAIQARALGLEVAGFSCLTNWAAGMAADLRLSHSEVLETGKLAAAQFARLLETTLAS